VVKFLNQLQDSLTARKISLNFSEAIIDHLAQQGYDKRMGARPLARKIDELIKIPLSRQILFEQLENVRVDIDFRGDQVKFTTRKHKKQPVKALING
jgi:ATP-dependent Clp protease ATP-binding subunit ClpA